MRVGEAGRDRCLASAKSPYYGIELNYYDIKLPASPEVAADADAEMPGDDEFPIGGQRPARAVHR
jgi:hypothetical protein